MSKYKTDLACELCGAYGPNDLHHIRTRKAGGGDTIEYDGKTLNNLIALCRAHHTELHTKGVVTMCQIYSGLFDWMVINDRVDILEKIAQRKSP